ncbi:hypothetical protein HK096_003658, partial [Nowakowskiella sp. JEL0078]
MLDVNSNSDQLASSLDSKKRLLDSSDNDSDINSKRLRNDENISISQNTLYNTPLISTPPIFRDTVHVPVVSENTPVNISPIISSSDVHPVNSQSASTTLDDVSDDDSDKQVVESESADFDSIVSVPPNTHVADSIITAPFGILNRLSSTSADIINKTSTSSDGVVKEISTSTSSDGVVNEISTSSSDGVVKEISASTSSDGVVIERSTDIFEADSTTFDIVAEHNTTIQPAGFVEDSIVAVSESAGFVHESNILLSSLPEPGLVEEFSANTEGFVNSSDDDHVATHDEEFEIQNDIKASVQDGDVDAEGSVVDESEVRANIDENQQHTNGNGTEKQFPFVEISPQVGTSKEAQLKHCLTVVRAVKKISSSMAFRTPVDPIALHIPNYTQIITRPMDISTIERKFKDKVYTSVEECMADFELMVNNSIVFNGPEHVVSKSGVELLKSFRTRLAGAPTQKSSSKPKPKLERKDSLSHVSPRSTFTLPSPRPKREIQVPSSRDIGYKPQDRVLQFSATFLRDLMQSKRHIEYTNAFLYPVDPVALNIPTYFDIIKRPMDLSTIRRKLDSNVYESGEEFEDDFRLMLRNCFTFNDPMSLVYGMGRKLEQVFNERWKARPAPSAPVKKRKDSKRYDDSESESDEDGPVAAETVQQLQKQLASISAALAQHGSTPGGDKKRKSKSKSKVKSSGGSIKKSSKKKQRHGSESDDEDSTRELSYKQKLDLSEKIGQLSQDDMMTAVEIIRARSGMAVTEDIELDVDQLDRGTQNRLYKFVQRSLKAMKGTPKSTTKIKKSQDSSSGSSDSGSGSDDS